MPNIRVTADDLVDIELSRRRMEPIAKVSKRLNISSGTIHAAKKNLHLYLLNLQPKKKKISAVYKTAVRKIQLLDAPKKEFVQPSQGHAPAVRSAFTELESAFTTFQDAIIHFMETEITNQVATKEAALHEELETLRKENTVLKEAGQKSNFIATLQKKFNNQV